MYVSIYIYIYIYIICNIHTHIHTYIHTYINTYIQTYIQTYIHTHEVSTALSISGLAFLLTFPPLLLLLRRRSAPTRVCVHTRTVVVHALAHTCRRLRRLRTPSHESSPRPQTSQAPPRPAENTKSFRRDLKRHPCRPHHSRNSSRSRPRNRDEFRQSHRPIQPWAPPSHDPLSDNRLDFFWIFW